MSTRKSRGSDRDREKRDRDGRSYDRDYSSDSDDRYDKERERDKEKEKRRDKEKDKEERRAREKKREKEREREDKDREKERRERAREKERDRERERERREREREKDKDKDRREREREKESDRERGRRTRDREKEKCREVDREYSDDDDSKERDQKRHRKDDDDYKWRDRERSSGKSHRQIDDNEASPRRKFVEDDSDKERKQPTYEEEIEEENKRLDEEMEKRRRRVQEWQELRRKKEEAEREKQGEASVVEEPKLGKAWTLDGESDDEEGPGIGKLDVAMDLDGDEKSVDKGPGDLMVVDGDNGTAVASGLEDGKANDANEEIDPLDAFMNSMVLPEVEKLNNAVPSSVAEKTDDKKLKERGDEQSHGGQQRKGTNNKSIGRIIQGEESDSDYAEPEVEGDDLEEDDDEFMKRVKKTKAEKLSIVDHSKIDYQSFKKNFYIEVKEISRMTPEEVAAYRKELELKIHGKDVPKPVKTWHLLNFGLGPLNQPQKLAYGVRTTQAL